MAGKTAPRGIGDFVKDTLEDFNDDGEINNSHLRPPRNIADVVKDALDDGELNHSTDRPQRSIGDMVKDALDDMDPKVPVAPPKAQRRPEPFEPNAPDPGASSDDVRSKIELFGSEGAEAATDAFMDDGSGELGSDVDEYHDYGADDGGYDPMPSSMEYDESTDFDSTTSYDSASYDEPLSYDGGSYDSEGYVSESYDGESYDEYAAEAF